MEQFVKYCLILFVIGGGYKLYAYWNDPIRTARAQGPNDEVIMYALTTCGACKQLAQTFAQNGIRFTEYDIDIDKERKREFYAKLEQMNYKGAIGVPVIDVNGVMLLNYPSLTEIATHFSR